MHTVVETFEASVGAPPPSKLASEISMFVKEPSDDEEPIKTQPEEVQGASKGILKFSTNLLFLCFACCGGVRLKRE